MHNISYFDLIWIFVPLVIVYYIYYKWSNDTISIPYALVRMVIQLIALGYFLTYIFETKNFFVLLFILSIMLIAASIISLRPIISKSKSLYLKSFISISIGGIITLLFVIGGVLDIKLWLEPRFVIPIAGMVFANSMNSVSIAAERFESEYNKSKDMIISRNVAYKSSLIPNINTLFAVGLVSIPGMMTGQILSGIDPMLAVNYQIMVMCMVILGGGISSAIYLKLIVK